MKNEVGLHGKPAQSFSQKHPFLNEMRRNWPYYLMMLPAMLVMFVFSYMPMPGLVIAFIRTTRPSRTGDPMR